MNPEVNYWIGLVIEIIKAIFEVFCIWLIVCSFGAEMVARRREKRKLKDLNPEGSE